MSDFQFRPSAAAVEQFTASVLDFGMGIEDKLDQANATVQFNSGQDALTRQINQFYLGLQSDPDWRTYDQKLAQFTNSAKQTINDTIKHQGAKNALWQWLAGQSTDMEDKAGQLALKGKQGETYAWAQQLNIQIKKYVMAGTLDPDVAMKRITANEQQLFDAGIIDKPTMVVDLDKAKTETDLSAVTALAFNAVKNKLPDGTPDWDSGHDILDDPTKTRGISETALQLIHTRLYRMEDEQTKKDTTTNGKIEDQLSTLFVAAEDKGAMFDTGSFDQLMNGFTGKAAGPKRFEWMQRYNEYLKLKAHPPKTGIPDDDHNADFHNLISRATNPESGLVKDEKYMLSIRDDGWKLYNDGKISSQQWKFVQETATIKHDPRITQYGSFFSIPPGTKDLPTIRAYERAHAEFDNLVDKKGDQMSDADVDMAATRIRDWAVQNKILPSALKNISGGLLSISTAAQIKANPKLAETMKPVEAVATVLATGDLKKLVEAGDVDAIQDWNSLYKMAEMAWVKTGRPIDQGTMKQGPVPGYGEPIFTVRSRGVKWALFYDESGFNWMVEK